VEFWFTWSGHLLDSGERGIAAGVGRRLDGYKSTYGEDLVHEIMGLSRDASGDPSRSCCW
jgi:hypothetical protein